MKARELSLGENQAILKLRKERKSIRAIAQALKRKNCGGIEQQTSNRLTKEYRNIVTAVKKTHKTSVSDITNNLYRADVKVSQSTV